jgi:drug/metabolite transporter (DMT)-like permease
LFAASGAALWGVSGVTAQALYPYGVSPQWILGVRALTAGVLLCLWRRPSLPRRGGLPAVILAMAGAAGAQYAYFAAVAHSNAPLASMFSYLALVPIAIIEARQGGSPLTLPRMLAGVTAIGGAALLVLGGQIGTVTGSMSAAGVAFGLLVAATTAVYTLSSVPVLNRYGSNNVTVWGFLCTGMLFAGIAPPWSVHVHGSPIHLAVLMAVMIAATLGAFTLFLRSLLFIPATEVTVLTTAEPVAATILAFLFLGTVLAPAQYLGGGLVAVSVLILTVVAPARRMEPGAVTPGHA